MKDNYKKLFDSLTPIEVPTELKFEIFSRIVREKRRLLVQKFAIFGSVTVASLATTIYVSVSFARSVVRSGFYDYLSLLLSGDTAILTYWRELSFSLMESLPVVGLVVFLTMATVFIWSSANTISNIRQFKLSI